MIRPVVLVTVAVVFFSCSQNNPSGRNPKPVLGSPNATVTTTPDAHAETGPLAYGPTVPAALQGDTVDV
ncbi:MAG TPA: hypothetical protein VF490_12170, partial [Chryseosolibacter sp.]